MIKIEDLIEIFDHTKVETLVQYHKPLIDACTEFGINNRLRQAAFLAQIGHESAELTAVRENLNYKLETLMRVFPKYFPNATIAGQYARNPEKIANKVYANRMGNGNEASGDGYKFRGRGFIQITGKYNYDLCGKALGKNLIEDPSYLETPEGAARSAGWYWKSKGLNELADKKDMKTITRLINGGYIGLDDRLALYESCLVALND